VLDPNIGGGIVWDDILSDSKLVAVTQCDQAVEILDQRVVILDPDNIVGNGKKLASDAARTLAMHLLAAQLNFGNGSCHQSGCEQRRHVCREAADKIDFDGTSDKVYLSSKSPYYAYALQLAKYLDAYNNSDCKFETLPQTPPPPGF